MKSKEKNNIILIRLFSDEDLCEKLIEACKIHNLRTGVLLSGIGQLKSAQLGFFVEKDNYAPGIFTNPLELLSLTGNICRHECDYALHLHAILGDEEKNAIGGHFIGGTISITGEIVLLKSDINIKRKIDDETGLMALILD